MGGGSQAPSDQTSTSAMLVMMNGLSYTMAYERGELRAQTETVGRRVGLSHDVF
ncbi:hypothetical protein BO85DRAFT_511245 [Aspergillus piperis CBS 112811]|uniref:Uncharacterized protein n=1 Tax=Aspergillus piperis CBS 112811 TaxID=1448313 RepID=A0A8G1R471_9EURO|nr:hypothetical protein BO85DRAFT_511245 [Aspergillus piperis CBS 112811]RAH58877.1 hypothetical protein BO85DRAFT_511245 [Aspergillus piperis CBS 112811]